MAEKLYLSAQGLLEDAFRLGVKIINSGFKPSFIVAIWRGGAPIGIAVQEILDYQGVHCDHIAIRTSSYAGIDGRADHVRVHGMNYLVKNVNAEDKLLGVDDVFDTGHTIAAVSAHLREKAVKHAGGNSWSLSPITNLLATRLTVSRTSFCMKLSSG